MYLQKLIFFKFGTVTHCSPYLTLDLGGYLKVILTYQYWGDKTIIQYLRPEFKYQNFFQKNWAALIQYQRRPVLFEKQKFQCARANLINPHNPQLNARS